MLGVGVGIERGYSNGGGGSIGDARKGGGGGSQGAGSP